MVWIFSEDMQPEHWRTAKPEHYLNNSLRDAKLASLNTSQPAVQPGKYWAKAVWDRSPYCFYSAYDLRGRLRDIDPNDVTPSAQKGDFESDPVAVFEVKAGETTTVKLQCLRPVVPDSINGSPIDPGPLVVSSVMKLGIITDIHEHVECLHAALDELVEQSGDLLRLRIERVLAIARAFRYHSLVLEAWG